MVQPIRKIVIVGGGTAGWITAAYLNHRLQWGATAPGEVEITVIESPDIPTIGVGEATVPTLKGTLRQLQISEDEFILRTDATFKLGIRFEGWQAERDGLCHHYTSPFTAGSSVYGRNPAYSFLRYAKAAGTSIWGDAHGRLISPVGEALARGKGPRPAADPEFAGTLQYAYHVDAGKLAEFFKDVCIARGVTHLSDTVREVTMDAQGRIASLELANHGTLPLELVIDCTGFRGLLINEAMGEPFVPFSDYLLNDRAVPIQVRRSQPEKILPATISRALGSGWSWRIPLHSRDGTGYVYSSHFASDDQAQGELQGLLHGQEQITNPRVLRMRVGKTRRSWVGNCVAIGASAGFVEPLESTAILSIELAVRRLVRYFPSLDLEAPLVRRFNAAMDRFYDEVLDHLCLHFSLSDREDTPYWRAVRHEAKRSDALLENLAAWKHALPSLEDGRKSDIFAARAVEMLLLAKGFYEDTALTQADVVPADVWKFYTAVSAARASHLVSTLPDHFTLLEQIRTRAVLGTTARVRPLQPEAIFAASEDGPNQLLRDSDVIERREASQAAFGARSAG